MAILSSVGTYYYVIPNVVKAAVATSVTGNFFDKWCANYLNSLTLFEHVQFLAFFPPNGITFTGMSISLGGVSPTPDALQYPFTQSGYNATVHPDDITYFLTHTSDYEAMKTAMGIGTISQAGWCSTGMFLMIPNMYQYVNPTLTYYTSKYFLNMPDADYGQVMITIKADIDTAIYTGAYPFPLGITRTYVSCVCDPILGWTLDHVEDFAKTTTMLVC